MVFKLSLKQCITAPLPHSAQKQSNKDSTVTSVSSNLHTHTCSILTCQVDF